jgi:signal peptidase I
MLYERSPTTAGIFSLIYPGLGHLYVGNLGLAVSIQAVIIGTWLVLGMWGMLSTAIGLYVCLLIPFCLYLFAIWHAAKLAKETDQNYEPRAYNSWWGYLGFILIFQIGFAYFAYKNPHILGVDMVVVKSTGMVPEVTEGDVLLINKKDNTLSVGDVVAFYNSDVDLTASVSRVAAVGGDRVAIVYGQVYRNGQVEPALSTPEPLRQMDYSMSMEERYVPPGRVFLLGDYRDKSKDSRFFGSLPEYLLAGIIIEVFFFI